METPGSTASTSRPTPKTSSEVELMETALPPSETAALGSFLKLPRKLN